MLRKCFPITSAWGGTCITCNSSDTRQMVQLKMQAASFPCEYAWMAPGRAVLFKVGQMPPVQCETNYAVRTAYDSPSRIVMSEKSNCVTYHFCYVGQGLASVTASIIPCTHPNLSQPQLDQSTLHYQSSVFCTSLLQQGMNSQLSNTKMSLLQT